MMSSNNGINLVHVNVRSIFRKVTQLEIFISNVDFLFCSETWLDNRYTDNMVQIHNMSIFRCDRTNKIDSYDIKNVGGGVCIYVSKKYRDYATIWKHATVITKDYESIAVLISKPTFRKMVLFCIYKPPKGKIKELIDFMKKCLNHNDVRDREIWILGDFIVDWLKRDSVDSVKLISFCKNSGLRQYIETVTRPNKRGGSCIDLIMSNSDFVCNYGIMNDIISDHYTVFCTRKKAREKKEMIWENVRDYSKYNEDIFVQILKNMDWSTFDQSLDPNFQWEFIRAKIIDILSVMCPYKRVFSRKYKPLWITPEIYRNIRERKRL